MKPSFFTLTVAPLTVLPFQKPLFSYRHSESLERGTIVNIPLSGRTIQGIVLEAHPSPNDTKPDWLKAIYSVEERSPLTSAQLEIAQAVSEMTFTPLGKVLKHFVPKKAKVRKSAQKTAPARKTKSFPKNNVVSPLLTLLKKEVSVFLPLPFKTETLLTIGAIAKKLLETTKGQILIITPDIQSAVRLEKAVEPYFPLSIVTSLYHTKTPGQYFEAWNQVQTGSAKIIIATRSGCFAPFKNLGAILQLDPSDEAYKQWDMSPRYHTQYVIPLLQEQWRAKLVQIAPLPSLSALKEKIVSLSAAHYSTAPEWINLKIERYQKNWSPFSKVLQTAIKETLSEKKQVLLYVHQSGMESFSVCVECRTIFRCPSCTSVLKLSGSDHYYCKHCGFKSNLFPQCPECKNIHFKSVGYGTEKVAREAKKLFPGAVVAITDKKHLEDHKKVARFIDLAEENEANILITTASFLRFPLLSRPGLTAIIDADTLLNLPGFRKDEQFINLIEHLKGLLEPKGRLLVQTFHPESDLFQKITKDEAITLLEQLLEERLLLRFPPFYRALALEARPKKREGAEVLKKTSKKLRELVSRHPAKKKMVVQAATRKVRGKDVSYTLLRYEPPIAPELTQFLARNADHIFIDHDPLHIT